MKIETLPALFAGLDEPSTQHYFNQLLQDPEIKKSLASKEISFSLLIKKISNHNATLKLQWSYLLAELSEQLSFAHLNNQFEYNLIQRKNNLLFMMRTILLAFEKTIKQVETLTTQNTHAFCKNMDFISNSLKSLFFKIPLPGVGLLLEKVCDSLASEIKQGAKSFKANTLKIIQKELLIRFETELNQSVNQEIFKLKSTLTESTHLTLSTALDELFIATGHSSFFDKDKLKNSLTDFVNAKIVMPLQQYCQLQLSQFNPNQDYAHFFSYNHEGDVITEKSLRLKEQKALEKSIGRHVWNVWLAHPESNANHITYTNDIWFALAKNDMVFLPKSLRKKAQSQSIDIANEDEQLHLERNIGIVIDSSLSLNRRIKQKLVAIAVLSDNDSPSINISRLDEKISASSALKLLPTQFNDIRTRLSLEKPSIQSETKFNPIVLQNSLLRANLRNLENTEIEDKPTRFGRFLTKVKTFSERHPWATPFISVVAGIGALFGWKIVVACAVISGIKTAVVTGSTFLAAKTLGAAGGAAAAEEVSRKTINYIDDKKNHAGFFSNLDEKHSRINVSIFPEVKNSL